MAATSERKIRVERWLGQVAVSILAALGIALALPQPGQSSQGSSEAAVSSVQDPEILSAGYYHPCVEKPYGAVACWGYDYYSQSSSSGGRLGPQSVSAGDSHTYGLKSDGTLAY